MMPNIADELLKYEKDIVGYQRLLRHVGMGNEWTAGVREKAEKLKMSTGRLTKFKNLLVNVGFIKVVPGDSGRGIPDTWIVLDIWNVNKEHFSRSQNETGDENFLPENAETCSPNETDTCSPNETQEDKSFYEEDSQDSLQEFVETTHSSSAAGESGERVFEKNPAKSRKPKTKNQRGKFSKRKNREAFAKIAEIWLLKTSPAERSTLSERERGQINQNLRKMRVAGYDTDLLPLFVDWWRQTWRAGGEGAPYEPPRPEQIVSFWNVMLEWARSAGKIRAPVSAKETLKAQLISPDEWGDLLRYCPDCYGFGRDITPGKGSPFCEHEKTDIIREKLETAVIEGDIAQDLFERFKKYLEEKQDE